MLNVYPIAATAENWVHEAICGKVRAVLQALNKGAPVPAWSEDLREELRDRDALTTRYAEFCAAAEPLSKAQRNKILRALEAQNNIPAVFDGTTACPRLDALPAGIQSPTKNLYEAAFDALKALRIRDRQYTAIFDVLPGKCCPFCGIEPFEAPGLAREDLDHYLPRHLYPFAGANLRNLPPMGGKCNKSYKLRQDPICDSQGQRRRCFDPYGQDQVRVSLLESRPFEGDKFELMMPLPAWQIDFVGEEQAVATWDQVFQIRRRYEAKINAHFRDWIEGFAFWCAGDVGLIETRQQVISALERYLRVVIQTGDAEGAHLKRAMFEMMRQHCRDGDGADRLAAWFSTLVRTQRQLQGAAA